MTIFVSLYIFRVHKDHVPRFVKLIEEVKPLILSYEARPFLFEEDVLTGKQGSMGLLNLFELKDDEVVYLGKIEFDSKAHYEETMKKIQQNEGMNHFYEQLRKVVDFPSLITSTFQDAEAEV
ncbi:hypothetical protein GCM10010954_24750 [Halobacillus andaensis]|uniref:Uncharacterized protein n=2 Tax=Halobacillus andaensis TaxID=1176239 RepID=A0A917EWE4_HALAA|nr:hypothetical protein GCM10010954_24750 [Halobacillus andaensis]